ncbi:peptidoglycan-binding domain-containing protein [Streptomyces flaveus]|uniref:peptidoglycan-binding domain-containing protein n=1 Tax=Streptomyces flaveus TaxID=66370 RepID=UPI0033349B7C
MSLDRRIGAVSATLAAAISLALVPTTQASAATPQCTTRKLVTAVTGASVYVPASSGGSTSCYIAEGSQSSAVWALQSMINCTTSGSLITVDSDFGPKTKAALIAMQKHFKISADGVYGPQTASQEWLAVQTRPGFCDLWHYN